MAAKIYGYARVSTKEQNLDRQVAALLAAGVAERDIITDKISGKNFDRPGYQSLRNALLRRGDTLIIKSLDRLSRTKEDIKNELQYYKEAGVRVKILDMPTTLIDLPAEQQSITEMINDILIDVLSFFAQQERETIRKRQREGIAVARKKGKHLGRPQASRPEHWEEIFREYQNGLLSASGAMRLLGLKKSTFYKFVNEEKT